MPIDHVTIKVKDLAKAKAFYAAALAPLGYTVIMEFDEKFVGLGVGGKPDRTKEKVDAFHAASLAAGGKDHGQPGIRKEYHPGYYGAFVLDPEGNNLEAVIHDHKA